MERNMTENWNTPKDSEFLPPYICFAQSSKSHWLTHPNTGSSGNHDSMVTFSLNHAIPWNYVQIHGKDAIKPKNDHASWIDPARYP